MYTAITVDDEKMIKRSIAALIESNKTGFEIVGEARDGIEAITLNEKYAPDLIITDIRMPKLNGLKFIEKLKEANTRSKFIIISGYKEFDYAQSAIRYGVVDFLLKPLKPEQFLSSLQKVHQQLEIDQEFAKERSEWLWVMKSFSEDLVQKLWLLEEKEVYQMINAMHEKLIAKQQSNEMIKRLYTDLFIYTNGELNKHTDWTEKYKFPDEFSFPDEPSKLKDALYDVCKSIIDHFKKTRNIGHRHNILTTVKYIESNYSNENISLQEVADMIDMSPSYFSMEFKAEMGISFIQFITKMRIDLAKELLNNPAYKTYEIAYTVGYSDYPHFTKTFKKHVGITPTQYRKRLGI
ncbi:response regulator transcription factor [Virgibacillus sp. L01]|uniref:response regulator transcription factor n=1 Tax=Virgibacillus sp. L01 TaxID=3457429 RepID=UPI003FD2C8E2